MFVICVEPPLLCYKNKRGDFIYCVKKGPYTICYCKEKETIQHIVTHNHTRVWLNENQTDCIDKYILDETTNEWTHFEVGKSNEFNCWKITEK